MAEKRDPDSGIAVEEKKKEKVKRPPLYKVLMHNDHYTTREFVVEVLRTVFHKSETDAVRIMLHVHQNGVGIAGIYQFEIAETKVQTVERLARQYEFPLRLSMEPADDDDGEG